MLHLPPWLELEIQFQTRRTRQGECPRTVKVGKGVVPPQGICRGLGTLSFLLPGNSPFARSWVNQSIISERVRDPNLGNAEEPGGRVHVGALEDEGGGGVGVQGKTAG